MSINTAAYRGLPTLEAAYTARTIDAGGGHLHWVGSRTGNGTPRFHWQGRTYTAYQVAYWLRTGRWPEGPARPECGDPDCVAPACVDDTLTRQRDRAVYAAITGASPTGCDRGHDTTQTRRRPDGRAYCQTCNRGEA